MAVVLIGSVAGDSFRWIFLSGGASFAVYFVCCAGLREGKDEDSSDSQEKKMGRGHSGSPQERRRDGRGKLFRSSQIFAVLLFAFALQLGLMYHGTFLGVYLVDLGFDNGMIGVMNCVSALSEVPVLFLINRIRKRVGIMRLLFLAVVLCALRLFLVLPGMWSGCFRRSCCRDRVTWFPISAV